MHVVMYSYETTRKGVAMHTFIYKDKQVKYPLTMDKGDAMVKANKELLWSDPDSKDGAWFPTPQFDTYQWVEGNFFD